MPKTSDDPITNFLRPYTLPPNTYDPEVWRRISTKSRIIARLPEGLTGLQALQRVSPETAQELLAQLEQRAANTYRRIYAMRDGNIRYLSPDQWLAFKAAGGQASW